MTKPETFLAIRRADREPIGDEYGWMGCDSEQECWRMAEEDADCCEYEEPVEYELVEMTVHSLGKRSFRGTIEEPSRRLEIIQDSLEEP